jgi:hypothetical protein
MEPNPENVLADLKRRQQEHEQRLEELIRAGDLLRFLAECQRFGLDLDHPGFKAMGELAKLDERRQFTGALSSEEQVRYLELWDQLKAEAAATAAHLSPKVSPDESP